MDEPIGKRCTKCGETKMLDGFSRNRRNRDGLELLCRECKAEVSRRYKQANPERTREVKLRWQEANREAIREAQNRWNAAHRQVGRERATRWRKENPDRARLSGRLRRAADRQAAFDHYGRSCACCGTTENLSIDHVDGTGREHREQIGKSSSVMHRWIIANGFPDGFQVLCVSCNSSKRNGDRCRLDHLAA